MLGTGSALVEEGSAGDVIHAFPQSLHPCKAPKHPFLFSLSILYSSLSAAGCGGENMCLGVKWTGVCISVSLIPGSVTLISKSFGSLKPLSPAVRGMHLPCSVLVKST